MGDGDGGDVEAEAGAVDIQLRRLRGADLVEHRVPIIRIRDMMCACACESNRIQSNPIHSNRMKYHRRDCASNRPPYKQATWIDRASYFLAVYQAPVPTSIRCASDVSISSDVDSIGTTTTHCFSLSMLASNIDGTVV